MRCAGNMHSSYYKWNMAIICNPPIMLCATFVPCFLYAGNIEKNIKVPLHLQLLVKWEVVSPNSRYRAFYHEIGNIEKCPFTYWLNGGGGFSKS